MIGYWVIGIFKPKLGQWVIAKDYMRVYELISKLET